MFWGKHETYIQFWWRHSGQQNLENQISGKIRTDIEDVYWKCIGVWMDLLESDNTRY
jgi:hypothetical protein